MANSVGREEIEVFYAGASDGTFTMDAGTARKCVDAAQTLIEALETHRKRLRLGQLLPVGGFESERQMYSGFAKKYGESGSILDQYIAAAQRLLESFLTAGSITGEEDSLIAHQITSSWRIDEAMRAAGR